MQNDETSPPRSGTKQTSAQNLLPGTVAGIGTDGSLVAVSSTAVLIPFSTGAGSFKTKTSHVLFQTAGIQALFKADIPTTAHPKMQALFSYQWHITAHRKSPRRPGGVLIPSSSILINTPEQKFMCTLQPGKEIVHPSPIRTSSTHVPHESIQMTLATKAMG